MENKEAFGKGLLLGVILSSLLTLGLLWRQKEDHEQQLLEFWKQAHQRGSAEIFIREDNHPSYRWKDED